MQFGIAAIILGFVLKSLGTHRRRLSRLKQLVGLRRFEGRLTALPPPVPPENYIRA